MPSYRVRSYDNTYYMDESERTDHGVFADADEAAATCKKIVDADLNAMWKPGTTAEELYRLFLGFGPDPFVEALNPKDPDVQFSAVCYAKQRCKDLANLRR
jgi:hypothetical protein